MHVRTEGSRGRSGVRDREQVWQWVWGVAAWCLSVWRGKVSRSWGIEIQTLAVELLMRVHDAHGLGFGKDGTCAFGRLLRGEGVAWWWEAWLWWELSWAA